jgi:uncharacterized protein (UPF0548 family)
MFQLRQPDTVDIRNFVQDRAPLPFNYRESGWTKSGRTPKGYNIDRRQVQVGMGQDAFERARKSMNDWRMFSLDWTRLCWPYKKIAPGSTVAVLALHYGFWSINCTRVVYVIDEPRLFAFAYGTLDDHVARGEERFEISWRADGTVWYEIQSFSTPNHWICYAAYPLMRRLQRRFLKDSMQAMMNAAAGNPATDPSLSLGVDL